MNERILKQVRTNSLNPQSALNNHRANEVQIHSGIGEQSILILWAGGIDAIFQMRNPPLLKTVAKIHISYFGIHKDKAIVFASRFKDCGNCSWLKQIVIGKQPAVV